MERRKYWDTDQQINVDPRLVTGVPTIALYNSVVARTLTVFSAQAMGGVPSLPPGGLEIQTSVAEIAQVPAS